MPFTPCFAKPFWAVVLAVFFWPVSAAANDWDAFDQPGSFALMRHALAPGAGDPAGFSISDCDSQRNLNAAGREQARRIGASFAERGIDFDTVLTSQWCRCRQTAELLGLAAVEEVSAFNTFFREFDLREEQTNAALSEIRARAGRPFIVTHQVNITALTGETIRSGEVLVVSQAESGLEVLGRILIAP